MEPYYSLSSILNTPRVSAGFIFAITQTSHHRALVHNLHGCPMFFPKEATQGERDTANTRGKGKAN